MYIPQASFSSYTAAPAPTASSKVIKSAFLESMHRMATSLSLDAEWAWEYENLVGQQSTFTEIFQLIQWAPDHFARGVIFGKLNVVMAFASAQERPLGIDYASTLSDGAGSYFKCHTALEGHGDWTDSYNDMLDFCSHVDDLGPVLEEMELILERSPDDFCRGVVFGKMATLREIQELTY